MNTTPSNCQRRPFVALTVGLAVLLCSSTYLSGAGENPYMEALKVRKALEKVQWEKHDTIEKLELPETRPLEGTPFTLDDLQKLQQKNANLYKANKELLDTQKELLKINQDLLDKLPKDDPSRPQVLEDTKKSIGDVSDTTGKVKKWGEGLTNANEAVNRWKKAKGLPPDVEPKDDKAVVVAPPPKKVDDLAKLKNLEKNLETLARKLGKVREAAVRKYLNDPSPANKRQAEAIKEQLDQLVNKLNETRHKVDALEGTDRPEIKIRTAREIASLVAREAGKEATRNSARPPKPEGHHHGPGGY